jgi:hypothetical protein
MMSSRSSELYAPSLSEQVSQGDVFRQVADARVEVSGEETRIVTGRSPSILLSFDCEYDKPRVDFVLIARVRPLAEVSRETAGNIRAGRMCAAFYLPRHSTDLPDSFVDLYHIVPVSKAEVQRLSDEGQRIASLSDDARLALQRQIAIYFSR